MDRRDTFAVTVPCQRLEHACSPASSLARVHLAMELTLPGARVTPPDSERAAASQVLRHVWDPRANFAPLWHRLARVALEPRSCQASSKRLMLPAASGALLRPAQQVASGAWLARWRAGRGGRGRVAQAWAPPGAGLAPPQMPPRAGRPPQCAGPPRAPSAQARAVSSDRAPGSSAVGARGGGSGPAD